MGNLCNNFNNKIDEEKEILIKAPTFSRFHLSNDISETISHAHEIFYLSRSKSFSNFNIKN